MPARDAGTAARQMANATAIARDSIADPPPDRTRANPRRSYRTTERGDRRMRNVRRNGENPGPMRMPAASAGSAGQGSVTRQAARPRPALHDDRSIRQPDAGLRSARPRGGECGTASCRPGTPPCRRCRRGAGHDTPSPPRARERRANWLMSRPIGVDSLVANHSHLGG